MTESRREARARLAAAGVDYAVVKAWAVESGRWQDYEVAALNVDAVDAYLSEHHPPSLARIPRQVDRRHV